MEVIKEFLREVLAERIKMAAINSAINAVLAFLVSNFFRRLNTRAFANRYR